MNVIKEILKNLIPEKWHGWLVLVFKYYGFQYTCPCCGGRFRRMRSAGFPLRLNAQCPKCQSFERHRLLILYLKNKTGFFKDNLKVLDIAPMEFFQKICKGAPNLDYTSADISSPLAMELYRVLKPGGWAFLQVPIDVNRRETLEAPSVTSPEERKRLFGQDDHVRLYGIDFQDRLKGVGFTVRIEDYQKELTSDEIKKYCLLEKEDIYICAKEQL
jgi:SAM-dependent methyltransferase